MLRLLCVLLLVGTVHQTEGAAVDDSLVRSADAARAATTNSTNSCYAKIADVMFVVDSSGSVGSHDFEIVKSFIKQIIDEFDVSQQYTRVGVIVFNSASKIEFGLGQYNTSAENKHAIDNIVFTAGGTNTGEALENLRQNGFVHARPGVPNIAIVITDGLSTDPIITRVQARVLKERGDTLIAIGVGNETNIAELQAIASLDQTTGKSMVYRVGSFAALQTLNRTVPYTACAVVVPTIIPPTTNPGGVHVTTGRCMNLVDNCDRYGRGVCSDYHPWATAHCAAYCGFCTGAATTTPPPCVNKIANCAEYGFYICDTTSMTRWANDNCRLYCNFCVVDPSNTHMTTTVAKTPGTTAICRNTVDNCADHGRSVCSDYRPWSTAHCAAYCGFCEGGSTTTAPPCVNNIHNCAEFGDSFCTTTSMSKWANTNCRLYCKFCSP